jgi:hypothetical protein
VFRKLGHTLIIVSLLCATGTHWAMLQSVAWTTMLAENLHDSSFAEAIGKTFDGQHPCCLCKKIAAGKRSDKKTEFTAETKQLEFISKGDVYVFTPPLYFRLVPEITFLMRQLGQKPPTPPPRSLLA